MNKAISLENIESRTEPLSNYPSHWLRDPEKADANTPVKELLSYNQCIQARRQGLYLAACIVDEVDASGEENPKAVIEIIRKRIAELVHIRG